MIIFFKKTKMNNLKNYFTTGISLWTTQKVRNQKKMKKKKFFSKKTETSWKIGFFDKKKFSNTQTRNCFFWVIKMTAQSRKAVIGLTIVFFHIKLKFWRIWSKNRIHVPIYFLRTKEKIHSVLRLLNFFLNKP